MWLRDLELCQLGVEANILWYDIISTRLEQSISARDLTLIRTDSSSLTSLFRCRYLNSSSSFRANDISNGSDDTADAICTYNSDESNTDIRHISIERGSEPRVVW
jgi:hypothetical protein